MYRAHWTCFVAVSSALVLGACGLDASGTKLLGASAPSSSAARDGGATLTPPDHGSIEGDASRDGADEGEGSIGGGDDHDGSSAACPGGQPKGASADIVLAAPNATSPGFGGNTGGQSFDDTCPPGAALVGVNVAYSSGVATSITHVQAVCARVHLDPCGVTVGPPTALVDHGSTPGTQASLACPPDNVVVGIETSSGLFIDNVSIDCAPIQNTSGGLGHGASTTQGPAGGPGGNANTPFACPPSMIANELSGSFGAWVTGIELGCATPIPH